MGQIKRLPVNHFVITKGSGSQSTDGSLLLTPIPNDTLPDDREAYDVIELQLTGQPARLGGVVWEETDYLVLDLLVQMDCKAEVTFHFSQGGRKDTEISTDYSLIPNRRVKMAVRMDELDSHRFFIPTYPGNYKGHINGAPTHISKVDTLRITLTRGQNIQSFTLFDIYLTDELPDMRVIGEPMVDRYGQWRDADWPDKIKSDAQLSDYLHAQRKYSQENGQYPEGWSRYGGWLKKRFDATGFFHTKHDGRRWWLVDPDGYAFFSNGCCYGSRCGVHGFVDKMENLFEWLPDNDPAFAEAWTTADRIPEFAKRNGVESGKTRKMFNFARANMIRVFGDRWWENWADINGARLRHYGFNTIGVGVNNYEDERVLEYLERVKIPFVLTLKWFPLTDTCVFRDFPDVYSEQYRERSEVFARQLAPLKDNPYLIGYFVTNEPEWLFQRSVNPAERVLAHPKPLATKKALVEFLRERYQNEISRLNSAWNLSLKAFDDLYRPIENADLFSEQSRADLAEFRNRMLEQYCFVPNEALKKVDGVHMNLGMRYAHIAPGDLAGGFFTDVFSFNCYKTSPAATLLIAKTEIDRPLLIGEWHFGGTDRRLLASGLLATPSQEERAKACAHYMQAAMADAACVGTHYFEYNDQPLLGRFDGECMQHGLIDVTNRPYRTLTEDMRATAERMYDICDGLTEPTQDSARLVFAF